MSKVPIKPCGVKRWTFSYFNQKSSIIKYAPVVLSFVITFVVECLFRIIFLSRVKNKKSDKQRQQVTVTVQSEKQDTGIELFSELGCSTFPTPSKTREIMRRQEGL